jgi:DNA-binding NarL/FixJ family response regulator
MSVPVVVSHAVARYRRGLLGALQESGFQAAESADLFASVDREGRRAVILSLSTRRELRVVARLQRADTVVLVLLTDPRPRVYREVLAAGGFPVAWNVPPAGIIGVLQAAINGQVLVPRGVAAGLAWGMAPEDAGADSAAPELNEIELHILGRVARGETDRRIASALRISERTLRRRLQAIFVKLGVESRIQASVWAARLGLTGSDEPGRREGGVPLGSERNRVEQCHGDRGP